MLFAVHTRNVLPDRYMKNALIFVLILIFAAAVFAQDGDAAADLQAALAAETNAEKAALLEAFLAKYPESELLPEAKVSLTATRAALADEKLRTGDQTGAVELFNKAIDDAPEPVPDDLFSEVIARFPANLFWNGSRSAAFDIARRIEEKVAGNAGQLVRLGSFYLGIEDGVNAKRVAGSAIAADPNSAPAFQMLGLANRMNFDLTAAADAYTKALQLAPDSRSARKSLAEMKRANGKPDEAAALYAEVLAADPSDNSARTGYALSLFDAGKRTEAEAETAKLLEANPNNLLLLSGAAYWYAANGEGLKAEDFASRAIAAEPRYIWSHIALGRALIALNDPVGAERVLVAARKYGDFPTLEYEIAAARMHSGFYREAAEELAKSFTVENGRIRTRLGRRIERESENFAELVGYERRASMFEPNAAAKPAEAELMKALIILNKNVRSGADNETVASSVAAFTAGDDNMRFHRTLYSADLLLESNTALPVVKELTAASIGKADAALDVASPAAAVMASELYSSRSIAFARGEIILVPDVPRPTLSAILRGRVEELAGRTFYLEANYPDAIVRLRRAISVLPQKSSWWRSSLWRLGQALEADGQDSEAIKAYVQSYVAAEPDITKYAVVERLFKKLNGTTDGLEQLIGKNPLAALSGEPAADETIGETTVETPPEATTASQEVPADETVADDQQNAEIQVESVPVETANVPPPTNVALNAPRVVPVVRNTPAKTQPAVSAELVAVIQETTAETPKTETKNVTESVTEPVTEPETESVITEPVAEPVIEPKTDIVTETSETVPETETPETVAEAAGETSSETVPQNETESESVTESPAESTAETVPEVSSETPRTETPTEEMSEPPSSKPLFESIIIEVPRPTTKPTEPTEDPETIEQTEDTNVSETAEGDALPETQEGAEAAEPTANTDVSEPTENTEAADTDEPLGNTEVVDVAVPVSGTEPSANPNDSPRDGTTRERVIPGVEIREERSEACSITTSQDLVSILNDGGSLGILVGVEGGSIETLSAESNSPSDVEVVGEPAIGNVTNRRFYIIRSVSTRPGMYEVKLKTGCGERVLPVRVR